IERLKQGLTPTVKPPPTTAPDEADFTTVFAYSLVILNGWCLWMIEDEHVHKEAAASVMRVTAGYLPPAYFLARVWELYNADQTSSIDRLLGVEHWDLRDEEFRLGFSRPRMGGAAWIYDGLLAAMLSAPSMPLLGVSYFKGLVPPRHLWRPTGLRERLDD